MRRITLTIALSVFFLLFPVLNAGHAQSADESTVLQLVNAERTSRGLQAYAWDSCLAAAATDHNNDMINNNFFMFFDLIIRLKNLVFGFFKFV